MERKKPFKQSIVVVLCALMFVSCFNNVDLSDISKDIPLMDVLILPLGKTVLRGDSLLKSFDNELLDKTTDPITIRFKSDGENIIQFADIDLQVDTIAPYTRSYSFYEKLPVDKIAEELGVPVEIVEDYINSNMPITLPSEFSFDFQIKDTFNLGLNKMNELDDQRIDSVLITQLLNEVTLISLDADFNIDVVIEFDSKDVALRTGDPAEFSMSFTEVGSVQEFIIPKAMLHIPTEKEGIALSLSFTISAADGLTITPSSKIELGYAHKDLDYEVIYGLFTLEEEELTSTFDMEIDIPNDFTENGWLAFHAPEFTLTVDNYIGAKFQFKIDSLKAYNDVTSNYVYAHFSNDADSLSKILDLTARPLEYNEDGVDPESQTFMFNKDEDKGQINRLFMVKNFNPNRISCRFHASKTEVDRTPEGELIPNFITKDLKMGVRFDAQIPLQLYKGSYFSYTDTIYDISESIDLGDDIGLDSISLYFEITNSLPLGATLSLTLLDSHGNEVNSTLNNRQILSKIYPAIVHEGTGIVKEANKQSRIVSLTMAEYDDLKVADKLLLTFMLDGEDENGNENMIALSSTNKMEIQLAIAVYGIIVNDEIFEEEK